MDCKAFREVLDLYVDGELSAEAMAAGSTHLEECSSCRGARDSILGLRRSLKEASAQHQPPPALVRRIERRHSLSHYALLPILMISLRVAAAGFTGRAAVRGHAAELMERVAFGIDKPHTVVLVGHLICRDCELKKLYGAHIMCERKGHDGVIETADGKIWNLMEGERSEALIHNGALRGKTVRIRGKVYRRAGCVEVESCEVL